MTAEDEFKLNAKICAEVVLKIRQMIQEDPSTSMDEIYTLICNILFTAKSVAGSR